MGDVKPFGLVLGIAGCAAFGWGLYNLLGIGSCGGEYAPCPADSWPYFVAVPAGIMTAIFSVFLGGGGIVFMGIFATVGFSSILRGFNGGVDGDETFPFVFGGMFLASALLPLALIGFGKAKMKRAAALVATGHRGIATVLEVRDTGVTINNNPRVELKLRVEPERGDPFEAEKTITVSRVAIPAAGHRYPVWFDPADRSKLALGTDVEPSAPPAIRALFARAAQPPEAPVVAPPPASPAGDFVAQLSKLNEMRLAGALSDEEFQVAKDKLLRSAT